ncbi:MAG: STAS domain-containing protein [Deltaproteobacteria bacterium]|nr:STAS domain-containing protein [Deltaproteobacteria bacterium]
MNQKFQATIQQRDDVTYLKLSGVIDEDNELFDILDSVGPGSAVINLSEIERINSCGVRDWVNWLNKLEKKGSKVVLVECSPAIVAQINLVNNFTGNGIVKSFYAPYFCPACDLEKVLLVDMDDVAGMDEPKAPICRCDECDGVMDFDDMEESYFAFVSTAHKGAVDAHVTKVVSELAEDDGSGGGRVKTRKSSSFSSVGSSRSRTGSQVSSVSLPSLPSVPSLPSLPSLSSIEQSRPGHGGNSAPMAPAPRSAKTNLVLIVVAILLLVAIVMLAYVIFGMNSKGHGSDSAAVVLGLLEAGSAAGTYRSSSFL